MLTKEEEYRLLLEELASRIPGKVKTEAIPDLLKGTFLHQKAFILDPARMKAAFCTRRSAKSYSGGLYLFKEALENPGVSCLYVALTRDSAKKIMWKDILKKINKDFKLQTVFNETSLTATLPNGSVIYVLGCDSTEDDKQKLLGQKYKLCVIDECASFTINLRELVYDILKPACADLDGTIACLGTPGDFIQGLFFDITTHKEPGWSVHTWSALDNPYVAKRWQEQIDELIRANPLIVETSGFKQHYKGLWVIDDTKLVYKFDATRNTYTQLPPARSWSYVLGVDLGYEDETAFVVSAYNPHSPILYIVHSESYSGMDFTAVANTIKKLDDKYDFDAQIVDGANKQGVAEMCNRHGLNLQPAQKQSKFEYIQLLNADLVMGNIKIHEKNASKLINELTTLIKDPKDPTKEHPSCKNHNSDGFLYNYRHTHAHLATPAELPPPKPGTKEYGEAQSEAMRKRLEDRHRRKSESESVDMPPGLEPPDDWDW